MQPAKKLPEFYGIIKAHKRNWANNIGGGGGLTVRVRTFILQRVQI
jgi:hypothetical protein